MGARRGTSDVVGSGSSKRLIGGWRSVSPRQAGKWCQPIAGPTLLSAYAALLIRRGGTYPMAMPDVKRRWTVAERDRLPDDGNRYEVIDGDLFVTPAPAWRHQAAVVRLTSLLDAYLAKDHIGVVLPAPADVVFTEDRGVQPDVFVAPLVDGRRPEHFDDVRR